MAPSTSKLRPQHVTVTLKEGPRVAPVALSLDVQEHVSVTLEEGPESPLVAVSLSFKKSNKWKFTGPDSLLVNVEREGEGASALLTVYVDREEEEELPYRGGYRDRRVGTKYLHATAQTNIPWPTRPKKEWPLMITRETHKSEMKSQNKQTMKEAFTQVDGNGVSIDESYDYSRIPGPYKDSDQWDEERRRAATVIQKYARRALAERTADRMRQYAREKKEFWVEQERKKKEEHDNNLRYEIERRMNPRTGADFEILFQELETWRLQELATINKSGIVGMDRSNAIKELLLKELKLLQAIDKLRTKAAKVNRKERIMKTIVRMGVPKMWEMSNGNIVHVRTPGTSRASDLMLLYKELKKEVASMDERMGVLGFVKWTVQVHDCGLTREVLLLIEREADLMYRGRPAKSLTGLRQRILDLFVQVCTAYFLAALYHKKWITPQQG